MKQHKFLYLTLLVFISCKSEITSTFSEDELTVSHGYVEGVTPSNEARFSERTYPKILANWKGEGGNKYWLGSNLGSIEESNAPLGTKPESTGWFFQFNNKQAFYDDYEDVAVPRSSWNNTINFESHKNWLEVNDPCKSLLRSTWRLPTKAEWVNFINSFADSVIVLNTNRGEFEFRGYENGSIDEAYNSQLKLHVNGVLNSAGSEHGPKQANTFNRESGGFWTSDSKDYLIFITPNRDIEFQTLGDFESSIGLNVRCIKD